MNRYPERSRLSDRQAIDAAPEKRRNSLSARVLVPGRACGPSIALEPLSLWGGYDASGGLIVDPTHKRFGESLAGRFLVMSRARGSSSSSSVLAEAIRNRTGPCGIILNERDLIIATGAIVANELYATNVPVVMIEDKDAFGTCLSAVYRIEVDSMADAEYTNVYLSEE